jgi:hypothetical protein
MRFRLDDMTRRSCGGKGGGLGGGHLVAASRISRISMTVREMRGALQAYIYLSTRNRQPAYFPLRTRTATRDSALVVCVVVRSTRSFYLPLSGSFSGSAWAPIGWLNVLA